MRGVVEGIAGALANMAAVLLLAPLCEGILRKVTARIQSRQGPPLLQPFFDLFKLLGKEDIESGEVPGVQRFAACLSLATVLAVACFLAMGFASPLGSAGDAILLIYLLSLCGVSTLLAGLAAGSTFSLLGVSREMLTMVALEPLLAIALLVAAVHSNSLRLDRVLDGAVYANLPFSGLLLAGAILLALPAYVQRVPFDVSHAETELMDGPMVEYSGPKLALFQYARSAKLVVYGALVAAVFLPWGSGLVFPFGWLLFWAKVLGLVVVITVIAATHARYRIDQAFRRFSGLLAVALGALLLAVYGY